MENKSQSELKFLSFVEDEVAIIRNMERRAGDLGALMVVLTDSLLNTLQNPVVEENVLEACAQINALSIVIANESGGLILD